MGAGISAAVSAAKSRTKEIKTLLSKPQNRDGNSPSILRVIVIAGRDLPSKDSNGLSDPYLVIEFAEKELKTDIRKTSLTPSWNQILDFPVWRIPPEISGIEEPRLLIKCWDWNESEPHAFMGAAEIDIETLVFDAEAWEEWHSLADPANESSGGQILLAIRWMTRPDSVPDAILSVNILAGRDLVPLMEEGFCTSYAVVKLRTESARTKVIVRSTEPEWQEIFEFRVFSSEIGIQTLSFECWDKGTFRDRLLGECELDLAQLTFDQTIEEWLGLLERTKEKTRRRKTGDEENFGRIHVKVALKKRRENKNADLLLRLVVLEARNLLTVKRNDTVDMYVKAEFENSMKKTQIRFKQTMTDRPTWSETFEFDAFSDRLDSVLRVTAVDHNDWLKDTEVGSTMINPCDLSVGDLEEKWFPFTDGMHPESKLEVKLQLLLRKKPTEKDFDAVLSIRVVEARSLPAMDYGGTSDPYTVINFEGKSKKTSTIFKTLNPTWNDLLDFPTNAAELDSKVFVECFDYDLTGKDDSCGRCEIDILGLRLNQSIEMWHPLRDMAHPEFVGEIFLEVVLKPLASKVEPDCNLSVKVVCAKGLVTMKHDVPNTYCQIEFETLIKKSGTRFDSCDPSYNESFNFVAHSKHLESKIRFEIFTYNLIGRNASLGAATTKLGDVVPNKATAIVLPLLRRNSTDPVGEVHIELLLKRLPEFFVSLTERSKSISLSSPFSDMLTGMTQAARPDMKRKFSLGSSGLILDFESTEPLLPRTETGEEKDEWQEEWDQEQERRRAYDKTRDAELRQETVESNMKKNRNRKGGCAWCGQSFSVFRKAIQDPVDRLWYHSWSTKTVVDDGHSCYQLHIPELKKLLKRQAIRDSEHSEELLRRATWDRDYERRKALQSGRSRLSKAIITDTVSKMMRLTRTGHDVIRHPPYCVRISFSKEKFAEFVSNSQVKRASLQQIRRDTSTVLIIALERVEIAFVYEVQAVEVNLFMDPEGKDQRWPQGLANRFAELINNQLLADSASLVSLLHYAIYAEVIGPVVSPAGSTLLHVTDIEVNEELKAKGVFAAPDQAGLTSVHVYICGDFEDMQPEREYLSSEVWPVVNRWLSPYRARLVPVDMRLGITKGECFHSEVVKTHLDLIDMCFPFFICLLGERYGWIPDEHYRNYGELQNARFAWLKDMPRSLSLVHIEILHGYFNRKVDDRPGGGDDDNYCLFYFRDKRWQHDARFLTDVQSQLAQIAAAKKEAEAIQLQRRRSLIQMEQLIDNVSLGSEDMNVLDVHILQGLDLAYYLEHKNEDDRNAKLKKKTRKDLSKEQQLHGNAATNKLKHAGGAIASGALAGGGMLAKGLAYGTIGLAAGAAGGLSKFLLPVGRNGADRRRELHSVGKKMKKKKAAIEWGRPKSSGSGQASTPKKGAQDLNEEDSNSKPKAAKSLSEAEEGEQATVEPTDNDKSTDDKTGDIENKKKGDTEDGDEDEDEADEDDEEEDDQEEKEDVKDREDDENENQNEDEEDEDDDDDDEDLDYDLMSDSDVKAVKIRQVQPSEDEHESLLGELRHLSNGKSREDMKSQAFLKVYRGRWWTCDRMKQYLQYVTDDHTRSDFLDGPTNSFKRCMDADAGHLNQLIDSIKDDTIRVKIRNKIAEWENTSVARGAVHGIVKKEESAVNKKRASKANRKNSVASDAKEGASGEGDEAQQDQTEEASDLKPKEPEKPLMIIKKAGNLEMKTKGFIGQKKFWAVVDFQIEEDPEDSKRYHTVKAKGIKIPAADYEIYSYDESDEKENRFCFKLAWCGSENPPNQKSWEFKLMEKTERDDWVQTICELTNREPKTIVLQSDGSGRIFKTGQLYVSSGGVMASWVLQECMIFCLAIEEICASDGTWNRDKILPMMFSALEFVPVGFLQEALDKHSMLADRGKRRAALLADKPSRYFWWKDSGLVLMVDHFGFSKQLLEYFSQAVVWDISMPGSAEQYEEIVGDAIELKEKELIARAEFIGTFVDPETKQEAAIHEIPSATDGKLLEDSNTELKEPENSRNVIWTSESKETDKQSPENLPQSFTNGANPTTGPGIMPEHEIGDQKERDHRDTDSALQTDLSKDALMANGKNFGWSDPDEFSKPGIEGSPEPENENSTEEISQDEDETKNKGGDQQQVTNPAVSRNTSKKITFNLEDSSIKIADQQEENNPDNAAEQIPDSSVKTQQEAETENSSTLENDPSAAASSQEKKTKPKNAESAQLYLFNRKVLALTNDFRGNPQLLENHETKEILWASGGEAGELRKILSESQLITHRLFHQGRETTTALVTGDRNYELNGTMRDFDNPDGQPENVVDIQSQQIIWQWNQHGAADAYDKLMKDAMVTGTYNKSLHRTYECAGKIIEVHCTDDGSEIEVVEIGNGHVLWNKTEVNALDRFSDMMQEAEYIGRSLFQTFVPAPVQPESKETILDLHDWRILIRGEDRIVLSFSEQTSPPLGIVLQKALGNKVAPKMLLLKFSSEEERDDWYRHISACKAWMKQQFAEKERWKRLAAEFKGLHVEETLEQAKDIVQVEEDQMAAYRSSIVFLIDYSYRAISVSMLDRIALRTSKKKKQLDSFSKQLISDLIICLEMKEDPKRRPRIRIANIADARRKQSWSNDLKPQLHYINLARKGKANGVRVEIEIDADSEYMAAVLHDPARAEYIVETDPSCLKTSKELVDTLLRLEQSQQSTLYAGEISKHITYAESKDSGKAFDDGEDDGQIVGLPIWLELQFRNEVRKSKVKGSQRANFDEVFRFLLTDEIGDSTIKIEVYTTKMFGKRLLGTGLMSLAKVVPYQAVPVTLTIDENEHGLIAAQVKLTPKKFLMPNDELRKKLNAPRPLRTTFQFLPLQDRHQTEDRQQEQMLNELKQVLRVEANVYIDYPCKYDGLDHLGRVKLTDLEELGEQVAEALFSSIRGFGSLDTAIRRPKNLFLLDRLNQEAYWTDDASLCVGRNDVLRDIQEYVHGHHPDRILLLCGQMGSGKSNIMSFLPKMFGTGIRIKPNVNTGILGTVSLSSFNKSNIGNSWNEPAVVMLSMGASLGNFNMRWFLYTIMSLMSTFLDGCVYPTFDSTNHPKDNILRLSPISGEYNILRLSFLTLCSIMDRLRPLKYVLIIVDEIEVIENLQFDWIPTTLPSSLRLIISCRTEDLKQKIVTSAPALDISVRNLTQMTTNARKELIRHTLTRHKKALDMEQQNIVVDKLESHSPDFLILVCNILASFDRNSNAFTNRAMLISPTTDGVIQQILEQWEDHCGAELIKHTMCLICTSLYGLTETELLVLLADAGRQDELKNRLTEQYAGQSSILLNPQTPYQDMADRLKAPLARLPYGLWAPVHHSLDQYMRKTTPCVDCLYRFALRRFDVVIENRYAVDQPSTLYNRAYYHEKIAAYFRARADPELQFSWRSLDFRAVHCLMHHLIGAKNWKVAGQILTDLGFIQLCIKVGCVHGLCADLGHALYTSRQEGYATFSEQQYSDIMQLDRFLNAKVELLDRCPSLLIQLMANEPTTSGVAQMTLRKILNGWEGRNWFRWNNKPELATTNIRTVRGHKGWIRSVVLTRDRKYIVSGADDRTAKFWAGESGALVYTLKGHRESITCVDISSSSRFLLTSSMDASVKLWDIELQVELANLFVGSAAMGCAFSPDGKYILAGTQNATLHIFTTKSYEEIHVLHGHTLGIRGCIFTSDSSRILSFGLDTLILVWEVSHFVGKTKHIDSPSAVIRGHTQGVRSVASNPRDQDQVASGGDDGAVIVWSLASLDIQRSLIGHEGAIYSVGFTPSGRFLLSASHDSTIRIWETSTGNFLYVFHGHSGPVYTVVASSDEYAVISAGADSTVRTWDLRGLLTKNAGENAASVVKKEEAAEPQSAQPLQAKAKPAEDGQKRISIQYGCINALSFSPDGDSILCASNDMTYAIRDTYTGELRGEPIRGHVGPVTCCQYHTEGRLILTGSEDTSLKVWDSSVNILVSTMRAHSEAVTGLSLFPTGNGFVSCSLDCTIRIWDLDTARELHRVDSNQGHKNVMGQSEPVRCCAASPDGRIFATGGDDNYIRVWDTRTRLLARKLIGHQAPLTSCSFSADGSTLLTGSFDKTACLWDLRGGALHTWREHTAAVSSVCFSTSGRHCMTSSWDRFVVVYSATTLEEVGRWYCQAACHSVASTNRYSVSGS